MGGDEAHGGGDDQVLFLGLMVGPGNQGIRGWTGTLSYSGEGGQEIS